MINDQNTIADLLFLPIYEIFRAFLMRGPPIACPQAREKQLLLEIAVSDTSLNKIPWIPGKIIQDLEMGRFPVRDKISALVKNSQ